MIIEYSGQTSEQKVKTLRDSVQRALEEVQESASIDIVKVFKETTTIIEDEVTSRTTLIRSFNGGTLTAYQGEPCGVYTNASGSVDIVTLSWSGTTPTITGTVASYGSSISLLDGKGIITSEEDQYHNYPLRLYGEEGTILGSADPVAMQSVGVARSFIYMPMVEEESDTQLIMTAACDYNGSLMGGDINATIEMKAKYLGQASSIRLTAGNIRAEGDFCIGAHNKVGGSDTTSVNSYTLNPGTSYTGIGCYFDLTPGTYILSGSVSFDGNASGRRAVQWECTTSGSTSEYTHSRHVISAGGATLPVRPSSVAFVTVPDDASTQRFSLRAWQNSESQLDVSASAKYVRIA